MLITIKRRPSANGCTIGDLYLDGQHQAATLEDVVRPANAPKVYGQTAIPAGSYRVIVNRSTRFSAAAGHDVFLPLLLNLPGADIHFGGQRIDDCGVRLHVGNTQFDSSGCILVGTQAAPDGKSIENSRIAFSVVFLKIQKAIAAGQTITLTIS